MSVQERIEVISKQCIDEGAHGLRVLVLRDTKTGREYLTVFFQGNTGAMVIRELGDQSP